MAQDQTELWQMACTFQGSTMCDCNLESPAWDWMCADVLGEGIQTKSLYLQLPRWLHVCGIQ